jgi:DNA-binding transcriptional regulator GbsR (MarR family)
MSEKVYCGAKIVIPKGFRRGTAEECIKSSQVRFYGINKIDPDIYKKETTLKKGRNEAKKIIDKIHTSIIKLRVRVRKAKEVLEYTKNIDENKDKINKANKDIEKYTNDLKYLFDVRGELKEKYGF